jgi:hypothetical protein
MSVLTNTICYVFLFAVYLRHVRSEPAPGAWIFPGGTAMRFGIGLLGQTATLIAIACTLVPGATDPHPLTTFLKILLSTGAMFVIGFLLYWFATRRRVALA